MTPPSAEAAPKYYGVQPGWAAHSTELSVEHVAAVPAHADQAQPSSLEHAMSPVFVSHAAADPVHELPFQLQPRDILQSGAATWVVHATGWPAQPGVQVQPELPHIVLVASAAQDVAVAVHEVVKMQPAIFPHSVRLAAVLQSVGVPEQLLVERQPFAVPHCCAERLEHAVALPVHVGAAPPEPEEPPVLAPPLPAVAPPLPAVAPPLPEVPAVLVWPACPPAADSACDDRAENRPEQ